MGRAATRAGGTIIAGGGPEDVIADIIAAILFVDTIYEVSQSRSSDNNCPCTDIVYRGEKSSANPLQVFVFGLYSKDTNMDLLAHARNPLSDSGYIATSRSFDIANGFAGKNGYIYVICGTGGWT
jgi:hypothetical protein